MSRKTKRMLNERIGLDINTIKKLSLNSCKKDQLLSDFIMNVRPFEFACGSSICAGWHYGKTTQLTDQNFQLGITQFDGTQGDIKTEEVWKWGILLG